MEIDKKAKAALSKLRERASSVQRWNAEAAFLFSDDAELSEMCREINGAVDAFMRSILVCDSPAAQLSVALSASAALRAEGSVFGAVQPVLFKKWAAVGNKTEFAVNFFLERNCERIDYLKLRTIAKPFSLDLSEITQPIENFDDELQSIFLPPLTGSDNNEDNETSSTFGQRFFSVREKRAKVAVPEEVLQHFDRVLAVCNLRSAVRQFLRCFDDLKVEENAVQQKAKQQEIKDASVSEERLREERRQAEHDYEALTETHREVLGAGEQLEKDVAENAAEIRRLKEKWQATARLCDELEARSAATNVEAKQSLDALAEELEQVRGANKEKKGRMKRTSDFVFFIESHQSVFGLLALFFGLLECYTAFFVRAFKRLGASWRAVDGGENSICGFKTLFRAICAYAKELIESYNLARQLKLYDAFIALQTSSIRLAFSMSIGMVEVINSALKVVRSCFGGKAMVVSLTE